MKHRTAWALVLGAAFAVAPRGAQADLALDDSASEKKLPPLKVSIDKAKVDLDDHRLEVKLSREAASVKIKVWGESGAVLADEEHDFSGKAAGAALLVTWKPSSDEKVAKIHVFGYDAHGYYSGVAIVPWALSIPHEEVNFETNSAKIRESEVPKLEASYKLVTEALAKHQNLGTITLFIAGHTDTVGTAAHNQALSRRRAQTIAAWFRKRGLKIPVAYEGFGESSPLVKTKDEVAEARNRRVDYVLSVEEPRFKTRSGKPAWKRV